MQAPLLSTFTLFTEIIVTISIGYIFYRGWKYNNLPYGLIVTTLGYEILFNITYMIYRTGDHTDVQSTGTSFEYILAAVHGTLSLVMFIALIAFLTTAWKRYKKGENYFAEHPKLCIAFLIAWGLAIGTGILFYLYEYVF